MKKIIGAILVFIFTSCSEKQSVHTSLKGEIMPAFNIFLSDSTTNLNTKVIPEGRPIVLFSFGSRCPYSRAQMDEIIKNINSLKEIRFYLITSESFSAMKQFCSFYKLSKYPNITVGIDYSNFFGKHFEALGVPYLAIYGKNKKLNELYMGKVDSWQIDKISKM